MWPQIHFQGAIFSGIGIRVGALEDAATYPAVWPSAVLNPMTDSWMCEVVCVFDAQMTLMSVAALTPLLCILGALAVSGCIDAGLVF